MLDSALRGRGGHGECNCVDYIVDVDSPILYTERIFAICVMAIEATNSDAIFYAVHGISRVSAGTYQPACAEDWLHRHPKSYFMDIFMYFTSRTVMVFTVSHVSKTHFPF